MKNNLFFILLLLVSGLLFWTKPADKAPEATFQLDKQPQEYMVKAFVTIFTEKGDLKNQLSADYWAYFPTTKTSTLIAPHLTVYKADGTLWHVDAKHGSLQQPTIASIEKIILQDHVILERPQTNKAIPIKLETELLDYHPKKQFAESDQFITMTKPGLKVTGTGLRAFLDKSSVELLHDVKTYYAVAR